MKQKQISLFSFIPPNRIYKRDGWQAFVRSGTDDFAMLFSVREDESLKNYIDLQDGRGVYVDVGANVGLYVLSLATRYPRCKVLAIEANHATFVALQKNVSLNPTLSGRVECVNIAAMDMDGEITLYERVQGNGVTATAHSSVFITQYREDDTLKPMNVKCATLDRITASIPQIELLKIDVEGAELAVLEGAHETLKKTKRIVVEIHGDNLDKSLNVVKTFFQNVEIVPYGVQSYIVANR